MSFVLIGGSTTLLILYAMSAAAVLAFAGTWQLVLGAGEDFGETVAALVMQGALYGGIFLVACGMGYGASLLILRAGRVYKPNITTLLGSGIALTAWSTFAGVFVMVYLAAAPPSQPWNRTTNAADQFLVVFIVALALISGIVVGALGWWLAAHLLRSRRAPRTVPWAARGHDTRPYP
ncbi:hypothetical protein [Paramicrobacterium agarici]|uniref:hypothetical protein n=1 Tax=Paramicrobacterium agarici TaxID=630514 RepID=UPI000BF345C9|nr:hypothetical protein [Microbacterium agarici]